MKTSGNALNAPAVQTMRAAEQLSSLERALLVIPLLYVFVFGLLTYFAPAQFASMFGFSGKDTYLYALAGGVTLGYVPGLVLVILQGEWTSARLVIMALMVFSVASLFGVAVAVVTGAATSFVYAIFLLSLFGMALTGWMLNRHKQGSNPSADTAPWLKYLLIFLTTAAFGTGALFTLAPLQVSQLFGFNGTDEFVFRIGGAATLGFAVMGVFELRSLAWREIRLPSINAFLFNGLSLIGTVLAILRGDPILLLGVVLLVTLVATAGSLLALQRQGK